MSGGTRVGPEIGLPTGLTEWERALTRHFLMVGPSGDASPIRSFEVSDATLAQAGGSTGADGRQKAMASFTRHIVHAGGLANALRRGLHPNMDAHGLPGCFAYLVLTLYVASLRGGEGGSGPFRHKLQVLLGSERAFMEIPGVASMWAGLQRWLSRRRADDGRYRELVFPEVPQKWVHIGISLKFAFPTKTDASLMTSFLHGKPAAADDPRRLLAEFTPFIDRGRRSAGMADAFLDFRDAFASGDRLLEDHRFWRLVLACASDGRAVTTAAAYVSCTLDEEGQPTFMVVREDGSDVSPGPRTLSEAVSELVEDCAAATVPEYLVFRQTGFGRWRSAKGFDAAGPRVRLAFPQAAHRRLPRAGSQFTASGTWVFSAEAIPVALAEEIASAFNIGASGERLASISVSAGVRTGGLWLGRPAFMPYVEAGGADLLLRPGPGAEGSLRLGARGGGPVRLHADGPVGGTWFIEPPGLRQRSCRQIAFTPNAKPHQEPLAADDVGEHLYDWSTTVPLGQAVGCLPADASWNDGGGAMADLVEAVYAGGRRGWNEGDLVGIVGEGFGGTTDPWAVLRLLRDATVIQPRLRHRWRGRLWTLRPPALLPVRNGAVVQGAVCEAEAELFRMTASALGCRPFRTHQAAGMSAPLVGCTGGDVPALAGRLGWRLEEAAACADARPMTFRETSHTLLGKTAASRWDWDSAKFVADGRDGEGPVSLTRHAQAACREHDVYQVRTEGREHRLFSRDAALVLAHCLARRPLFAVSGGVLEARVRGAFLPDGIAARLRLSSLANPSLEDGLCRYPLAPGDAGLVARLLPGAVSGAPSADANGLAGGQASVRHSAGRIRAAWTDGSLTSTAANDPSWGKGVR